MRWKLGQAKGRKDEFMVSEHNSQTFHLYSRTKGSEFPYTPLGTYKSYDEAKEFAGYFNDQSE